MKVLYFAWLRERTGVASEDIPLPDQCRTVGDLVALLKTKSPGHAEAFSEPSTIKVAVNQDFGSFETAIAEGDEVAFFPPVTGGR